MSGDALIKLVVDGYYAGLVKTGGKQ